MKKLRASCVFMVSMAIITQPFQGFAQLEKAFGKHIYLISVKKGSQTQTLTGFKVRSAKLNGILTALHGVNNAKKIIAEGDKRYENLLVTKIDMKRDLALLQDSKQHMDSAEGIRIQFNPDIQALVNKEVYIIGHPLGIARRTMPLRISDPATAKLRGFLTEKEIKAFQKRKSPDVEMLMLSINGPIQPGHSGAPIIDNGQAIGIGNGGLRGGTANIGWASIADSNSFQIYRNAIEIKYVASDSVMIDPELIPQTFSVYEVDEEVFAEVDIAPPSMPIKLRQETRGGILGDEDALMLTDLEIKISGEVESKTFIKTNGMFSGFCGKVKAFVYDADNNILFAFGWGSQACVGSKMEALVGTPSSRTVNWIYQLDSIRMELLNKAVSVRIAHTPGSKKPSPSAFKKIILNKN